MSQPSATPNPPQPLTAVNDNSDSNASAPYGTRSTNRTRGVRPNYAEDKDIDIEGLGPSRARAATSKKPVAILQNEEGEHQQDNLGQLIKKTAVTNGDHVVGQTILPSATGSEATNHTASQVVNGTNNHSAYKKRKQPGSSTTISAPHSAGAGQTRLRPSQPISQRYPRETNIMTFDDCRARLNGEGQLCADDGTVLGRDGMYIRSKTLSLLTASRSCIFDLRTTRGALLPSSNYGVRHSEQSARRTSRVC